MTRNRPVPSAKDVLPKGLLAKLQRHCSGLIYIPAPQTRAEMNMARVRSLHSRGHEPAMIAQMVGLSARRIRDIIRLLEDGGKIGSRLEHKIYESVPREVVELVQRHACGLIYVPPKATQADRRRARVKRMLDKDLSVSEIAKGTGVSERRVWQIKESELEAPRSRVIKNETRKRSVQDPFAIEHNHDVEEHSAPRVCPACRSVLRPDEQECEMCQRMNAGSRKDSDEIVISRIPFAVLDRNF